MIGSFAAATFFNIHKKFERRLEEFDITNEDDESQEEIVSSRASIFSFNVK